MVKFETTNIVGSAAQTTWSQAQAVIDSEGGQLLIVVQVGCDDSTSLIDLAMLGSEILTEIEKKDQSIDKIVSGVAEGIRVDILVGSLRDTTLSINGMGAVEVYLSRNGKLAKLENNSVGEIKENDVVVLATTKFVEVVGLAKFRKILTRDEGPAELLAPLVHMQTETSGVAAIVGVVGGDVAANKISWWQTMMTRNPKIKMRSEAPRKMNLWIGGVILFLLVIMVGVGMVRRVKVISERDYLSVESGVRAKIEETLAVGDLNPERARILLSQARSEVGAYLSTNIKEGYKQKGTKLMEEIDSAEERAFKKNDIQLGTVVELPILAEGLAADKMKSDGKENLIFLDSAKERVVAMNLVDRSRQIIDTAKSETYVDVGVSEARVYGLNMGGVDELFWKKDEIKKVIEPDEFWKNASYIETFAGNVYILDKEQSEIWKYPTLGDTFGGRRRWLAVGITPDLSNVVEMKVVGDIWLLTSTGKLERYSRGAPVTFGMEGFPAKGEAKKLSEPTAMWVTDSLVYVLENGAARVVVFGVDGKYQSQYANSEFGKASDLVIVDDKGYVLIDNVVKEFGL